MKKLNKILFLFVFAVFAVIMAISVSAATEVDGIWYDLNANAGTAAVSQANKTNCQLETVLIPSQITVDGKDYTVTSLSNNAFGGYRSGNANIKNVTIPYTVTTMGNSAFQSCENMVSITFENTKEHPSQLTSIGMNAFWECKALKSIFIPKSVTTILSSTGSGGGTFRRCTALETVIFEEGCALTEIQDGMFYECSALKGLILPNNVEKIGERAFQGCTSLTKLSLGESLTEISGISMTFQSNICKRL